MKILHVISDLRIGGAQKLLSELLPLQSIQSDVSLLLYNREYNDFESLIVNAGIKIISLNESNIYNPKIIFKMRRIFVDFDVVHVHLFPSLYWAAFASSGLKIKLVYTEHSTSNSRRSKFYFRPIERYIYKHYKKIISISQQTQDALTEWLHSTDNRFTVVNNGIDIKRFSNITMPINPNLLIMISRFVNSKDQDTVIRALSLLPDNIILRFVGDGERLEHCKKIAKQLNVYDRIEYLGARSDIPELISESNIGIQSSNWEGFGLTAVEIMACGKPIVASDVDGLKQVVQGAGILFEKGNENILAEKILKLINDRSYYMEVQSRCIERAKKYDIGVMLNNYTRIYNELS